ncbi:hypothetical protein GEMRC1_001756 [Eukaryota sp. GEM-RC1]
MSEKFPLLRRSSITESLFGPAGIDFTETKSPDRLEDQQCFFEVMDMSATRLEYYKVSNPDQFLDQPIPDWVSVRWIGIVGIYEPVLHALARHYGIHPLTVEDIILLEGRSKVDIYDHLNYSFISLELITDLEPQQLAFILIGNKILISVIETDPTIFAPLRRRLRYTKSKERAEDASFLLYSLLDLVVDKSFPFVNSILDEVDNLDRRLLTEVDEEVADSARHYRQMASKLRRHFWSTKEVINILLSASTMSDNTKIYLADVLDHVLHLENQCEVIREVTTSVSERYHNAISLQVNHVMKTLSLISQIFLPLTFLSSVYGMNFRVLPGSQNPYAFELFWIFCLTVVLVSVWYFRRKRWM